MDLDAVVTYVEAELAELGNPESARAMAAYMKTDMPFYGVGSPHRKPIARELKGSVVPQSRSDYEGVVDALWRRSHRETKYLAIGYACDHDAFITADSLPLYERMVREGQWWDFVDQIAAHLVGGAFAKERERVEPTIRAWIDDPDMWIRRTAILSQIRHQQQTDEALLFDLCLRRAHEKEFFIRKAIGWALRSYAHTSPDAVAQFLIAHRDRLSGLSFREAAKHLDLPA